MNLSRLSALIDSHCPGTYSFRQTPNPRYFYGMCSFSSGEWTVPPASLLFPFSKQKRRAERGARNIYHSRHVPFRSHFKVKAPFSGPFEKCAFAYNKFETLGITGYKRIKVVENAAHAMPGGDY